MLRLFRRGSTGANRNILSKNVTSSVKSRGYRRIIDPSKTTVRANPYPKVKVAKEKLIFGRTFTDHMLVVDWDKDKGWHDPAITPYENLSLPPACAALHYAIECFEGMKAYKDSKGAIRLFRPDLNLERLNSSMTRLAMPSFNADGLLECMKQLLLIDASWFPEEDGYSVYIRPTAIGNSPYLGVHASEEVKLFVILCPVGPYFKEGFKPVKLYADTQFVRAWPGGAGNAKVGGNYAPAIMPTERVLPLGCSQILWLFGEDHQITEVGSMNIFFALKNDKVKGGVELVTAPLLRGDILPGVTRRSIIELSREWNEFEVSERWLTMREVQQAAKEGRVLEAFGSGTAAVVSPVKGILYKGEEIKIPTGESAGPIALRLWKALGDIQYGRVEHPWSVTVE